MPVIEDINEDDIAVVELSSFQLISMRKSPDVAVITNIYPDHLNVHSSMEEYISAKTNLIAHQNALFKNSAEYGQQGYRRSFASCKGKPFKIQHKSRAAEREHTSTMRGGFVLQTEKTSEKAV